MEAELIAMEIETVIEIANVESYGLNAEKKLVLFETEVGIGSFTGRARHATHCKASSPNW
jgi:hypothetical protein